MNVLLSIVGVVIPVVIGLVIYSVLSKRKRSSNEFYKNTIETYLTSPSSPLTKYVISLIDQIDSSTIGSSPANSQYDMFKELIIESISHKVRDAHDQYGYDHFCKKIMNNPGIEKYMKEYGSCIMGKIVSDVLHSSTIDSRLGKIYTDALKENLKEAERIEKEAEIYHESFGVEPNGDPVLHPSETNTNASEDDDFQESDINHLTSMGTAEDVED